MIRISSFFVAGAGFTICALAGARHPSLDWTEVALVVGAVLAALGMANITKEE